MDYTWEGCNVCGEDHVTESCPELGLLPSEIHDPATTKARLTLPHSMCVVDLGEHEVAVIAQSPISRKTQYGPFEAKKTTHEFNDDSLFLLKVIFRDSVISLDTTSENECNWLCLVRTANTADEQNMIAYQMGTSIYYSTIRDIALGEELKVWYAAPYARKIGKSVTPDGVSRVMLNMEVIYPSIDDVPESFQPEVPQGPPTQEETTLEDHTMTSQNMIQSETTDPELLQVATHISKTDKEQQTMVLPEDIHMMSANSSVMEEPEVDVVMERTDLPHHACQRCEQTFTSENDLAHHLIQHLSQTEEKRKKGKHMKSNVMNEDVESENIQTDVKKETAEEDWETLGVDDPSDPDFTGAKNMAFTVYEVSYKERPRRSMRSRRKIDKDFLYLSNSKGSRKTTETKDLSRKSPSEETLHLEFEEMNADIRPTNSAGDNQQSVVKKKRGRGRPRKQPFTVNNIVRRESNVATQHNSIQLVKSSEEAKEIVTEILSNIVNQLPELRDTEVDDIPQEQEGVNITVTTQGDELPDGVNIKVTSQEDELPDRGVISSLKSESTNSLIGTNHVTEENTEREINPDVRGTNTASECAVDEDENYEIVIEYEEQMSQLPDDQQQSELEQDKTGTTRAGSTIDNMTVMNEQSELEREETGTTRAGSTIDNLTVMNEMKRIKTLQKLRTKYKHVCKHCGKHFKSIHYLKLHLPMHTGKFSCKYCGFNFARKESMIKHVCKMKKVVKLLEMDGKDVYQCLLCDKDMEDVKEVKEHYLFHSKEVRCMDCNQVFGRQQLLRDHICPQAPEKLIKCDICKHPFPSEKSLMRHLAIHTDIFKCPNCLKTFARKDSQLKHILVCCPERAEEYGVYACSKCRKGFATKLGLDNHEAMCEQEFCDNCNKVFDSLEMLKKHQETCDQVTTYVKKDKVLFSCSICKKSFRNLNYLYRHKELHSDQLECSICKKLFKAESDLDEHYRFCLANSTITEKGSAACEICKVEFFSTKAYREHYQTHTHPYSCEKCKKRFIKVGTLHNHQCLLNTALVECHHCQQQFPGHTALKAHIKKEHRRTLQCKSCMKIFIAYKEFETHMCVDERGNSVQFVSESDLSLIGDKPICHVCGKEFTTTSNLNKHLKIHGEKNVECEFCGKKFHHEEYLKVHVEGVHEKKHKFQCEECGKFLTSKPGLTSHIKQFHSDEKVVYPCSECGKVFNQKGNRKMHMYSHMKEKLFKCDECEKTFKYPEQLKKHKFIHLDGEKLKCESCDKMFPKQADLEKHMQTAHSGLMYVCNVCNSRCAHKHTLLRHYKRKHPEYAELTKQDTFVNSLVQRVEMGEETPMITYSYVNDSIAVPMETVTIEENTLPQVAAEALKSLSGTIVTSDQQILTTSGIQTLTSADIINVPTVDGNFQIQNLVQDPSNQDDQQTVVILQIVNPENEQGVVTEEVEVIGNVIDLPEVKENEQGQYIALH
ncbi:uncharacterized protein LOC125647703 isoform X2 [Ostrea edulis]|uniref:uncharacterized protein LOC125647703 isoform X2 n=1 Tax=Ostrea edulis TaxID=37623 RepID=UPI0024AEAA11|nr:uncharacterized protein LOC125647703 isoform X2 [Ostrea edulis]XP_055997348.1 uncharacterized protein LOC125647703 isoform X2 [Ostrea edulis]